MYRPLLTSKVWEPVLCSWEILENQKKAVNNRRKNLKKILSKPKKRGRGPKEEERREKKEGEEGRRLRINLKRKLKRLKEIKKGQGLFWTIW